MLPLVDEFCLVDVASFDFSHIPLGPPHIPLGPSHIPLVEYGMVLVEYGVNLVKYESYTWHYSAQMSIVH